MIDYFLRTDTQQELYDALVAAGLAVIDHFEHDEEGAPVDVGVWRMLDGAHLDEIGAISRPTGEVDDDGIDVLEPVEGYHANLRLVDIEPQGALPVIPTPSNPARVWL